MFRVEVIGLDKAPLVQSIYERSPRYFLNTDHRVASPQAARENMEDQVPPSRRSPSYEKLFCLMSYDQVPFGIVDLHKDHPQRGVTYVGLFLLDEQFQKMGWGRKAFEEVEHFINRSYSCSHLRLGVSTDNDVEGFWRKLGFVRNGRTYTWNAATRVNQVFEMEKKL